VTGGIDEAIRDQGAARIEEHRDGTRVGQAIRIQAEHRDLDHRGRRGATIRAGATVAGRVVVAACGVLRRNAARREHDTEQEHLGHPLAFSKQEARRAGD